jgi:flagellar biosynthesis anti-sigma factor FlgM
VSERARLLAKARVSLNETPDVRSEKVDTLREKIETGNYPVPYDELARRLMPQVRPDQG